MSPSAYGNIKMAVASLKAAKMRSFLTMLGVIIGVVSVVSVISIGEGIKHQVSNEINQLGQDLITIRPGDVVERSDSGAVDGVNFFYSTANTGSLAAGDIATVQKTPGVGQAAPLAIVQDSLSVDGAVVESPPIVLATTAELENLLLDPIKYGEFIQADLTDQPNGAVIGSNLANRLFGQRSPLGSSFEYLGQTFFVRGVMKQFDASPLSLTTDFNDVILIPYATAQKLTNDNTVLYEILAKPAEADKLDQVVGDITANLSKSHSGQERFSVLSQEDSLAVADNILDLLTMLIIGIAAISLLVGGIGIMDVMLVSVTERMHEIGLRKALGASNRQIMMQFLTEASVLSVVGGVIGVVISLIINFVLRVSTSLTPVITWQAVVIPVAASLVAGIVFGTAPALKAARKDPIEALRNQ